MAQTSVTPPRTPRTPRKPSPLTTFWLCGYNSLSIAAWAYILFRCWSHMLGSDGYTGLKEVLGAQGAIETLGKRARSGFSEFGDTVKWVQTAAVLEAVHSALGLVRSPLGTTVAQIFSRLALVWGVCEVFPQVPQSPFYISMVTAWCFAEIIRYTHYATALVGVKSKVLEWLRYTAFYILYPVGAGSEAVLIALSAPYAKEKYGTLAGFGVYAFVSIWPPALYSLMTYMHSQRRKHLSLRSVPSSAPSSVAPTAPSYAAVAAHPVDKKTVDEQPSTPVTAAVSSGIKALKDVTSKIAETNIVPGLKDDTPARSTRSRAKKAV